MNLTNMIPRIKKIVRFLLGVPLTIAAFYFIGLFLYKSRGDIMSALESANYVLLALGLVFFVLFFLIKNVVWLKILEKLGAKPDHAKSFFLLSFSETKRYIPGSIFSFVARVKTYSEAQIPVPILVKSLVIESLLLMVPSMVISIPGMLFIYPELARQYPEYQSYLLPLFVGIVLFAVVVIGAASYIAKKKLKIKSIQYSRVFSDYGNIFVLSALGWFFFGVGNYLVATSIHALDPRHFLAFTSFFVLSWFIGYISILTPMGLGVREAVLILGLSPFAPIHITTLIALFSRVAFMAGEFLFLGLSFLPYHFEKVGKKIKQFYTSPHLLVLWTAILSYVGYFTYLSFAKYQNFFMGKFDLGNMDQTVWNTLHGRIFMFTNPDGTESISRLAFHADFILILLAPLYLLWSDARMLLLSQSVILGLGAYVVYHIALTLIKSKNIALVFAISFLLNPLVQRQNLYDFHAVVFATTFLLAAWLCMIRKKYLFVVLFLLLAGITKENVWIVTGLMGIYIFAKHTKVVGSIVTILSFGAFFLLMKKFIPDARGGEHFALEYLAQFGDSTTEIAKNVVLQPLKTLAVMIEHDGLGYLLKLAIPLGFLMILAPLFLIFPGADLTKNILSTNSNLRDITYQYNAEIIPFLFIASVYGVAFLIKRGVPKTALMYYLIIWMLFGTWKYGMLPGSQTGYIGTYTNSRENAREITAFLETIPDTASVTAMNNLGSKLSQREEIYVLPQGVDRAEYVLFLLTDWYEPLDTYRDVVRDLENNPEYELVYQNDQFYAFKRIKNNGSRIMNNELRIM